MIVLILKFIAFGLSIPLFINTYKLFMRTKRVSTIWAFLFTVVLLLCLYLTNSIIKEFIKSEYLEIAGILLLNLLMAFFVAAASSLRLSVIKPFFRKKEKI